jgi:hypothetical protein
VLGVGDVEPVEVPFGIDHADLLGHLPGGALDLLVALVADEEDGVSVGTEAARLRVNLVDERTGRVDDVQPAALGLCAHFRRYSVCGEDHGGTVGHLFELVDAHCASSLQLVDHMAVVDDLLAHVDGCSIAVKRTLDHLNGPLDAGAGRAGRCQDHLARSNLPGPPGQSAGGGPQRSRCPQRFGCGGNRMPELRAPSIEHDADNGQRSTRSSPRQRRGLHVHQQCACLCEGIADASEGRAMHRNDGAHVRVETAAAKHPGDHCGPRAPA